MVKNNKPQAAYHVYHPISGFQLYSGESTFYYKVGGEKIAYNFNKSRFLKCPFKHCDSDILGYLGGKLALHHCLNHGFLMIKPQDGIVCTFNKDGRDRTWSIDELVESGVIELNLYFQDQCVYTSKKQ